MLDATVEASLRLANLIVLPCIGVLGLGKCVLLYSFTNCLTNWACGNFGLFGTHARPPKVEWLNYIGLSILLIGNATTGDPLQLKKVNVKQIVAIVKNKPYVNDELTLPSLASGGIWGVAQTLFNCSLKNLSQSVSGPIGAILPSFFASLWAVFYFREIRGTRNFILLFVSMLFTSLGAVSIALSKELEL
ncbi:hypothetical protein M3Y99_01748600 [Aphelenchoides fujianensis]|nr:hypothetical protein M3Y99_01748600 [Aphelenchoides fujianensis]